MRIPIVIINDLTPLPLAEEVRGGFWDTDPPPPTFDALPGPDFLLPKRLESNASTFCKIWSDQIQCILISKRNDSQEMKYNFMKQLNSITLSPSTYWNYHYIYAQLGHNLALVNKVKVNYQLPRWTMHAFIKLHRTKKLLLYSVSAAIIR